MNTASEIRENLIRRIKEIDDVDFLNTIYSILNQHHEQSFILSKEQKESIKASEKEFSEGKYQTHEKVMTGLKAWLKEQ